MQKSDKRRDSSSSRLKKIWRAPKQSTNESSESGGENSSKRELKNSLQPPSSGNSNSKTNVAACSLPLLQIWPSQDSPRGEADGQSFVFSVMSDDITKQQNDTTFIEQSSSLLSTSVGICRRSSLSVEHGQDSGIESVQASPSPIAQSNQPIIVTNSSALKQPQSSSSSPTPSDKQPQQRLRKLLHPDHARIIRPPTSPDNTSIEDMNEFVGNNNGNLCTASSSTTSSQTSIAAIASNLGNSHFKRLSDPWLHRQSTSSNNNNAQDEDQMESQRRRSTGRYSLLDALDLEYALLRAAARGSVGPYSLSESIHKLTFTQSLAFPALARSITSKRRHSIEQTRQRRPLSQDPNESGLNLLAKFVTACVLVLVSFLVFFIVYKFSST
ncbi:hypothetical protein PVAND_010934 [Polypedilum vanderplanki]|uniref:Uncharacterized protein n=1 Tax=Polypedilum vanderplanki TaxID=319348 RepID=A0A9J6CHI9_POLVA|nr:hypothetical protein PVAND_010934 [Polypedilum vanderplanki]